MNKPLEPTPEEHAYHIGWCSFSPELVEGTNPYAGITNPYDESTELTLFEEFNRGFKTASNG